MLTKESSDDIIIKLFCSKNADMAESADALDSGSSRGNSVEVQVLLSAPYLGLFASDKEPVGLTGSLSYT